MRFSLRLVLCCVAMLCGLAGLAGAAATPASAGHQIIVVPIEGTVDEGMAHLVERAVARADAEGAEALVLDVNTPGGLVASAFEIRDALLSAKVPTVAFVSRRAYSAGALISLAAKKIVMEPGSSIGAAEPIPNDPKHVAGLHAVIATHSQGQTHHARLVRNLARLPVRLQSRSSRARSAFGCVEEFPTDREASRTAA